MGLPSEKIEWRLELVQVPVSDVDRAKAFYVDQVGFIAEHDHRVSEELTALRSADLDADAARAELVERGVEASEVQEFPWGRFVFFADPDGNGWAVQEIVQSQG
jgi:predicted enzyme related to lactoylglutathione lyase